MAISSEQRTAIKQRFITDSAFRDSVLKQFADAGLDPKPIVDKLTASTDKMFSSRQYTRPMQSPPEQSFGGNLLSALRGNLSENVYEKNVLPNYAQNALIGAQGIAQGATGVPFQSEKFTQEHPVGEGVLESLGFMGSASGIGGALKTARLGRVLGTAAEFGAANLAQEGTNQALGNREHSLSALLGETAKGVGQGLALGGAGKLAERLPINNPLAKLAASTGIEASAFTGTGAAIRGLEGQNVVPTGQEFGFEIGLPIAMSLMKLPSVARYMKTQAANGRKATTPQEVQQQIQEAQSQPEIKAEIDVLLQKQNQIIDPATAKTMPRPEVKEVSSTESEVIQSVRPEIKFDFVRNENGEKAQFNTEAEAQAELIARKVPDSKVVSTGGKFFIRYKPQEIKNETAPIQTEAKAVETNADAQTKTDEGLLSPEEQAAKEAANPDAEDLVTIPKEVIDKTKEDYHTAQSPNGIIVSYEGFDPVTKKHKYTVFKEGAFSGEDLGNGIYNGSTYSNTETLRKAGLSLPPRKLKNPPPEPPLEEGGVPVEPKPVTPKLTPSKNAIKAQETQKAKEETTARSGSEKPTQAKTEKIATTRFQQLEPRKVKTVEGAQGRDTALADETFAVITNPLTFDKSEWGEPTAVRYKGEYYRRDHTRPTAAEEILAGRIKGLSHKDIPDATPTTIPFRVVEAKDLAKQKGLDINELSDEQVFDLIREYGENANRGGQAQTISEDFRSFFNQKNNGTKPDILKSKFKTLYNRFENLSNLKKDGALQSGAIIELSGGEAMSKVKTIANTVGELRGLLWFKNKFTDKHESELANFLYENGKLRFPDITAGKLKETLVEKVKDPAFTKEAKLDLVESDVKKKEYTESDGQLYTWQENIKAARAALDAMLPEAAIPEAQRPAYREARAAVVENLRTNQEAMDAYLIQGGKELSKQKDIFAPQEDAARKRIDERNKGIGANIPLQNLVDWGIIGSIKVARGTVKFAEWSAEMIAEFGEKIKPHLQALYKQATTGFYLKSRGVVVSKFPEKVTSEVAEKTLLNSGISPDEIKWVLSDLFAQAKKENRMLSQKEILDTIDNNHAVEVENVVYGGSKASDESTIIDKQITENHDEYLTLKEELDNAIDKIDRNLTSRVDVENGLAEGGKASYVLEEFYGDSYYVPKELLESIDKIGTGLFRNQERYKELLRSKDHYGSVVVKTKYSGYKSIQGGENYGELLITLPNVKGNFESTHWQRVENPVAHVRFDERNVGGKKTLFIHEMQSDWAREGRYKGFVEKLDREQQGNIIGNARMDVITEKESLVRKVREKYSIYTAARTDEIYRDFSDYLRNSKSEQAKEALKEAKLRLGDSLQRLWDAEDRLKEAYKKVDDAAQGVADAPFVRKWQELATKKVVQYAVENGYDKVAWATGEQVAGMFDLRKHIDRLDWQDRGGRNGIQVWGFKRDQLKLEKNGIPHQELDKHIPKNVAEDIRGKIEEGRSSGRITGDNLAIGGEWADNLYDKQFPQLFSDLGKRYGAVAKRESIRERTDISKRRIGDTFFDTKEKAQEEVEDRERADMNAGENGEAFYEVVRDKNGKWRVDIVMSNKTQIVNSFDIPDNLRKVIKEQGQSLFGANRTLGNQGGFVRIPTKEDAKRIGKPFIQAGKFAKELGQELVDKWGDVYPQFQRTAFGRETAERITSVETNWKMNQGKGWDTVKQVAMKRAPRNWSLAQGHFKDFPDSEGVSNYRYVVENRDNPEVINAIPKEIRNDVLKYIDEGWRIAADEIATDAEAIGLQVWDKDKEGNIELRDFKRMQNYLPRMFTKEFVKQANKGEGELYQAWKDWQEAQHLKNYISKIETQIKRIDQQVANPPAGFSEDTAWATEQSKWRAELKKEIDNLDKYEPFSADGLEFGGEGNTEPNVRSFGSLENPRYSNAPDYIQGKDGKWHKIHETDPHDISNRYIGRSTRRLAFVKEFGQFDEDVTHIGNELAKEGKQGKALSKHWTEFVSKLMQGLPIEEETNFHRAVRFFNNPIRVLQLSGSALAQVGGLNYVPSNFGVRASFRGATDLFKNEVRKGTLQDMRMLQGVNRDFMSMNSTVTDIQGFNRQLGEIVATGTGNKALNHLIDDYSMLSAKHSVEGLVKTIGDIRDGSKVAKGYLNKMWGLNERAAISELKNKFHFSDVDISQMISDVKKNGKLSEYHLAQVAQKAPAIANAISEGVLSRQGWMHKTLWQNALNYTNFTRAVGRALTHASRELKYGNIKPMLYLLVGTAAAGEVQVALKNLVYDRDRKDEGIGQRLLTDWTQGALFGLPSVAIEGLNYAFMGHDLPSQKIRKYIGGAALGPTSAVLFNLGDAAYMAMNGVSRDKVYNTAVLKNVPLARAIDTNIVKGRLTDPYTYDRKKKYEDYYSKRQR